MRQQDIEMVLQESLRAPELAAIAANRPERASLVERAREALAAAVGVTYATGSTVEEMPLEKFVFSGPRTRGRLLAQRPQDLSGTYEYGWSADGALLYRRAWQSSAVAYVRVSLGSADEMGLGYESPHGLSIDRVERRLHRWREVGDLEIDVYLVADVRGGDWNAFAYARRGDQIIAVCTDEHSRAHLPPRPASFFDYDAHGKVTRAYELDGVVTYSTDKPTPWPELRERLLSAQQPFVEDSLARAIPAGARIAAVVVHTAKLDVGAWVFPSVYVLTESGRQKLQARKAPLEELWNPAIDEEAFVVAGLSDYARRTIGELSWSMRSTTSRSARVRELQEPLLAWVATLSANGLPDTPTTPDFAALVVEDGSRWDTYVERCIQEPRRLELMHAGYLPRRRIRAKTP